MKGSGPRLFRLAIAAGIVLLLLPVAPAFAATTQVRVVRYADDGFTILNETTLSYQQMRDTLPVQGDGVTHYFHQGPVFVDDPDLAREQDLRWNPAEDTNVQEKDMGAVKGTNLRDLCDLGGGITDGETVKVKASDGLSKIFSYGNIYAYSPREGPVVVTWFVDGLKAYPSGSYPDTGYSDGMRLVWFADTSTNPWGIHAFGNYDWHEAADPEYWYYYQDGAEKYPTTTGLSVKYVSEVRLMTDDPATGDIHVTSIPPGAGIIVDDSDTGILTNGTVTDLDLGTRFVRVALEGYREVDEQEADVRWGVPAVIHFNLVRMVGSVAVTSTPGGAAVYLDGMDTGNVTPCTLSGVAAGDHVVTVKLPGYTDGSDALTVVDGETVDLELELVASASGSGTGTVAGDSSIYGGTLITLSPGVTHGGVLFVNTTGPAQVLGTGASATKAIRATLPEGASPKSARLYLYTARAPDETGASTGTDLPVTISGKVSPPVATYRDCRPGGISCTRVETRVWDLPVSQVAGSDIPVTVRHPGGGAGEITYCGAALVVVYERPGDPETGYWIAEGADSILADPDLSIPGSDALTTVEFAGIVNRSRVQQATLLSVSTSPADDPGNGDQVAFNGNEWESAFSGDGVRIALLEVRPYLEESGNQLAITSEPVTKRGDLIENRNAILVVVYGESPAEDEGGVVPTTTPGEGAQNITPAGTGAPPPVTTGGILAAGEPETPLPSPSPANTTPAPGEGAGGTPGSFLEGLLGFLLPLLAGLFGQPGGGPMKAGEQVPAPVPTQFPATMAPVPALAGGEAPAKEPATGYNLTITTSPRRALVSLDGASLGKVSPLTLTGLPAGSHTLRLEMENFRPFEQVVEIRGDTTLHVNMTSAYPGYASLLQGYEEIQKGDPDHCGSVYVESFPDQARILLDGKETGLVTSSLLSGLKPGLHTIRLNLENRDLPDTTRAVWIYPSAGSIVRFGSHLPVEREILVDSGDLRKAEFTIDGRYPAYRIPRKVTLGGWDSYITVRDNGTYLSFPAGSVMANETLTVHRVAGPLTSLQVISHPAGADILVDGFPTGLATPSLVGNLSPGLHRILVSAPGLIPQEQEILQLDIPRDGPDAVAEFYLEPYPHGALRITSTPPGARIYLYGRDTGERTPHTFPYLGIGTYDVRLVSSRDSQVLYDLTVTPYGMTTAHLNLSAS